MEPRRTAFIAGVGLGVAGVIFVLLVTALFVVYTGSYNVAATEDHTPVVRWGLTSTMRNSVKARAEDLEVPKSFSEAMTEAGASEYKTMCQHCHGGVGVRRDEWASGMLPQPPHLPDVVNEWEPREIYWLVKHGLKMSGMPAFGPTHSDDELWNIVAFVRKLPGMTSEDYTALGADEGGSHGQGHSH